jgi:hypothetical protein
MGSVERAGDLLVRESSPIAKQKGLALTLGERFERFGEAQELVAVGLPGGDVLDVRGGKKLDRSAARAVAKDGCANVGRNLKQPGSRVMRSSPGLQAAPCVQVRDLERVLGFLGRAEPADAEPVDPAGVLLEQSLGLARRRVRGRRAVAVAVAGETMLRQAALVRKVRR